MPEDPDEADGVLLENVLVLVGQLAAAEQETVDALGFFGPSGQHQILQRADETRT